MGYKSLKENNILEQQNPEQALKDLQARKEVVGFFKEENIPFSFYTLTASLDRGMFVFFPDIFIGTFWHLHDTKEN